MWIRLPFERKFSEVKIILDLYAQDCDSRWILGRIDVREGIRNLMNCESKVNGRHVIVTENIPAWGWISIAPPLANHLQLA